jgi:hypothetical protein
MEDLGVEATKIFKCILNRIGGRESDSTGSNQGGVASCLDHGNEKRSNSVTCREFLYQLQNLTLDPLIRESSACG